MQKNLPTFIKRPASITAIAGIDCWAYDSLKTAHKCGLWIISLMTVVAAIIAGLGVAYGMLLLGSSVAFSVVVGLINSLFCLNIFRMLNAGSGYSLGRPIKHIDRWLPSLTSTVFLMVIGSVMTIPLAIWLSAKIHSPQLMPSNIFDGWDQLWANGHYGVYAIALFILLFSAFSLLKLAFIFALRAYETVKWQNAKTIILNNHSQTKETMKKLLRPYQERPQYPPVEVITIEDGYESEDETTTVYKIIDLIGNRATINRAPDKNTGKHAVGPRFFEQKVRDILLHKDYPKQKEDIAKAMECSVQAIENKLLYAHPNDQIRRVFEFEWANRGLFTVDESLEKNTSHREVPTAQSCPSCQTVLTAIATDPCHCYFCPDCDGTLITAEHMASSYGSTALATHWADKKYAHAQGISSLKSSSSNTYFLNFELASSQSTFMVSGYKKATLFYCPDKQLYWLPLGQLKAMLTILKLEGFNEHRQAHQ